jgi:phospholipase C
MTTPRSTMPVTVGPQAAPHPGLLRSPRWASLVAAALAAGTPGCDGQKGDWGLSAILTMKTPPDDPNLGCGVVIPPDPAQEARASCTFGAGALASTTLGIDSATAKAIPIRHVIVLMKENRSFDHLLGNLHERGQPGVEPIPASYVNPDVEGAPIAPFHATTTCWPFDPGHQYRHVQTCLDGGLMDGFVRNAAGTTPSDGTFAMSNYDDTDLPFYYFLARSFAIGDRHFAPMATGTGPSRAFLLFGTNAGVVDAGIDYPPPYTPSIFHTLMNAGYTWAVYTDSAPFSGALDWGAGDPGVHPFADLLDALDGGSLPNVAFVDGLENLEDDHPVADLQRGEAWVKNIYDHAVASPQWPRTAILWTYDEVGGFADHVPPPPGACNPDPSIPLIAGLGPRVPIVAISPWAKRTSVSHVVEDHTAITRFIEAIFDLPALTPRDANQSALFDLFDFSCGRDLSLPAAPEPGTGGCAMLGVQPD